jgi:hypothetical protein
VKDKRHTKGTNKSPVVGKKFMLILNTEVSSQHNIKHEPTTQLYNEKPLHVHNPDDGLCASLVRHLEDIYMYKPRQME